MNTLYLVATPIGNLEDMTFRAVRILREVALVAAEDTRHSGKLLKHYAIPTPLTSFHEYSDEAKVAHLIDQLAGGDVALISDAGTPTISDPGYRLIRAALDSGYAVTPVPGANAATTALIASGLPTDRFLFVGFLSSKQQARREALAGLAAETATLILYESPKRLTKLLADAHAVLGDRDCCVARELTKLHEELFRGRLSAAQAHFAESVRGEITLVIRGAGESAEIWTEATIRAELDQLIASGLSKKQAANQLATLSGWRSKQIYQLSLAA
jgi:16S rRNA (cytidine1402-2'-O)-methyltransferase